MCFVIVEWSPKGKLIAVARKDTLNILSSNFVEKSSMLLSFKSWINDPDTNCIVKGMSDFTAVFWCLFTCCVPFVSTWNRFFSCSLEIGQISTSETEVFLQSSVDTIRWIRNDSIILGCFQLNADGNEENYLVQVIQIKHGKFTNVSNLWLNFCLLKGFFCSDI